ncbi:MAG: tetratricopeptide repeat protein, partial [Bacteroidota bacterium]
MRSFLLIVLLYSAFTGRAQRVLVDSIEGELAVATLPAERMDLLLGLIRARVFYSGGDSAQPDVQRAIAYARKIADPTAEASAMIFGTQVDRDDPEQLFANSLNGIRVGQLYDDPSLEFFGRYHLIEDYLYDKNDVNKSKQLIDAALAARRPGIGHKQLGNLYKVIGIHYQGVGQVDSMLHYFHWALREFVDVGEDPDILPELGRAASTDWDRGVQNAAQVWLYLSRHYANQRDYTRADSLVAAALAGAQRYDSPDLRAWALEEMGWLHRVSGRYGEAIEAYEEAYAIYDAMGGADRYLADISYRIGDLMVSSGNPAAAPPFFERSLRHHEYTTDTIGLKNALFVYGNAALRLGDLDLAARHLEKVLELNRHLRDTIHNGYLFN